METTSVSFAAMPVTSFRDFVVAQMNEARYKAEKHYQVIIAIVKEMLRNDLITQADYCFIEGKLKAECNPIFPDKH